VRECVDAVGLLSGVSSKGSMVLCRQEGGGGVSHSELATGSSRSSALHTHHIAHNTNSLGRRERWCGICPLALQRGSSHHILPNIFSGLWHGVVSSMPCCGGCVAPASVGARGVLSAGPVSIPSTRSAFVLLPLVGA